MRPVCRVAPPGPVFRGELVVKLLELVRIQAGVVAVEATQLRHQPLQTLNGVVLGVVVDKSLPDIAPVSDCAHAERNDAHDGSHALAPLHEEVVDVLATANHRKDVVWRGECLGRGHIVPLPAVKPHCWLEQAAPRHAEVHIGW